MKSSLKLLALGLLLFVPFATAHAQAPSLSTIPNVSMNAGTTRTLNVVAVDVGGRPITLTSSLPTFATLNPPTSGTGTVVTTLTLTPLSGDVANYTGAVTVTPTAGGVSSTKIFEILVNAAGSNQAQVVSAPALRDVTAGSNLNFTVSASDADGDAIASLDVAGLPSGASFTQNVSNTSAIFNWTPGDGDPGEYDVTFTASNSLSGSAVTHIHVESAPTLTINPIDDVTVAEGASISVPVNVSGVPGAVITLTASLPTFANLNPPGVGTGAVNTTITVSPPTGSTGTHHASVTATSLGVSVTETFDVIVTGGTGEQNHPPTLTAPANATVAVGATLNFDVTATDPDGDHVVLSGTGVPSGSTFSDHGDNTGTFSWSPTAGQAGTHIASFSGTDGRGGSGSASTTIMVTDVVSENHAPTLSAPATVQTDEGVNLSFTVTASDQDGDHVALSASSLPSSATFSDQGDNTGLFSWTPGSTESGVYNVLFVGDDGRGGTASATTTITVNDVGGGGAAEVPGKACLIGSFQSRDGATCFRIRPVNGSFDVKDVVLSSITFVFHGGSVAALNDGTRIELHCRGGGGGEGDDGDDDHGEGHDGDRRSDDGGKGHSHDAAALRLGGDHPHGDDADDDGDDEDRDCGGIVCGEHGGRDHDGDSGDHPSGNGGACDTLGIRACFSTQALLDVLAGAKMPCDLVHAEIHATLTNGATVVATFGKNNHEDEGEGDKDKDTDKDRDKGKDKDEGKDHGTLAGNDTRGLNPKARPNPLNPKTELSFTMSREGRVRVTVYDMQGRLVKTLLDDIRATGEQRLSWDGSNARSEKVASGVYFFRIQAPEGEVIHRVAVVK